MTTYPEATSLKLTAGMLARIDRAARRAHQGRAEWLRALVRQACENSERNARRHKAEDRDRSDQ